MERNFESERAELLANMTEPDTRYDPDIANEAHELDNTCDCGCTLHTNNDGFVTCPRCDDQDCDCDTCLDWDAELARDRILETQELEDFEQADEYFGGYGDDSDGW